MSFFGDILDFGGKTIKKVGDVGEDAFKTGKRIVRKAGDAGEDVFDKAKSVTKKGIRTAGDVGEDVFKVGKKTMRKAGDIGEDALDKTKDMTKDAPKKIFELGKKIVHYGAKSGFFMIRQSYLLLLKLNMFNVARALWDMKRLDPSAYKKARYVFWQWGGEESAFDKEVERGASRKPPLNVKMMSADASTVFFGPAAETVGAISGGMTILASTLPFILAARKKNREISEVDENAINGYGDADKDIGDAIQKVDGTKEQKDEMLKLIKDGYTPVEAAKKVGLKWENDYTGLLIAAGIAAAVITAVVLVVIYKKKTAAPVVGMPRQQGQKRLASKAAAKPAGSKPTVATAPSTSPANAGVIRTGEGVININLR